MSFVTSFSKKCDAFNFLSLTGAIHLSKSDMISSYTEWRHSGLFFLCRNIQFGVFRAEIFILWCIVQKYWSGIVTCYMKMRQINELHADLASFLFNCAGKNTFWGFVQKYYCPELLHLQSLVQGSF